MVKNIIFDMDGVLVDSENAIRVACVKMFENMGVHVRHEDFIPFTGMGENRFIGGVAEQYGLTFELSMKERAYQIYGKIAPEYVVVYDGIRELIHTLRSRSCKIAVASAADAVKVNVNLRCMGFSPSDFDALVTGNDVAKHKPDPDVFLTAARKLGAYPAQCLVVEDAVAGCQAAKAAGMHCIGVLSTFDADMLKKAGADRTVERTTDILACLEEF